DQSNKDKKGEALPHVPRADEKDVAHQHVLDLLVAFCCPAEQQNGGGSCYDVGNANDRFLWNLASALSGEREKPPAQPSKAQRDEKRRPAFKIEVEQDRHTNA